MNAKNTGAKSFQRDKKNGGHSKSQTRGDEENNAEKDQRPRKFVYKMKSSQSVRIGSRCTRINARA